MLVRTHLTIRGRFEELNLLWYSGINICICYFSVYSSCKIVSICLQKICIFYIKKHLKIK